MLILHPTISDRNNVWPQPIFPDLHLLNLGLNVILHHLLGDESLNCLLHLYVHLFLSLLPLILFLLLFLLKELLDLDHPISKAVRHLLGQQSVNWRQIMVARLNQRLLVRWMVRWQVCSPFTSARSFLFLAAVAINLLLHLVRLRIVLLRPVLVFWLTPDRAPLFPAVSSAKIGFTTFSLADRMTAFMALCHLFTAALALFTRNYALFLFSLHLLDFKHLLSFTHLHMKTVVKHVVFMCFFDVGRMNFLEK